MTPEETKQIRTALREELAVYTEQTLIPTFGKYTEEIVVPAIEASEERLSKKMQGMKDELRGEMKGMHEDLTQQIGNLRSDLIDFVDRKIETAKDEIIAMIRTERRRERLFKIRLVELLEQHNIGTKEELTALKELIVAERDAIR